MRLVEAEQRNAALEASLQAQRAQGENDRLELLARSNQLEEEQQARAPKVYEFKSIQMHFTHYPDSRALAIYANWALFIFKNCIIRLMEVKLPQILSKLTIQMAENLYIFLNDLCKFLTGKIVRALGAD